MLKPLLKRNVCEPALWTTTRIFENINSSQELKQNINNIFRLSYDMILNQNNYHIIEQRENHDFFSKWNIKEFYHWPSDEYPPLVDGVVWVKYIGNIEPNQVDYLYIR